MNCLIPNVKNEQDIKVELSQFYRNGMAKQGNENVKLSDFLVKIAEGQMPEVQKVKSL